MLRKRISYPLFCLLLIISFSCEKENKVFPKINILSPADQSIYAYGDTLLLEFRVEQRNGPVLLNLMQGDQLYNLNWKKLSEVDGHFTYRALWEDPYLPGGDYEIRVQVYNGENHSSRFLPIRYQASERQLTGWIYLMAQQGQRSLKILEVSGTSRSLNLQGDYPYLAVNHQRQMIITAPRINGKLRAYDLSLNPLFTIPNPSIAGAVQYQALFETGGLVYALDNEGFIRAYADNASPVRNYQLDQNRIPLAAAANDHQQLLVAAAEPGLVTHRLLLLNAINGAELRSHFFPDIPIDIVSLGSSEFFILARDQQSSVLYRYNAAIGQLMEWSRVPSEIPIDLEKASESKLYLITDRALYSGIANASVGTALNRELKDAFQELEINSSNALVYLVSNNRIFAYTDSLRLVQSENHPMVDLKIIYNQ